MVSVSTEWRVDACECGLSADETAHLTQRRSMEMGALTLHPMKEIRVMVSGGHGAFVTELLGQFKATGYTIIGNVSGKGHHGVREAHFMSSEQESLEMIMTVVP